MRLYRLIPALFFAAAAILLSADTTQAQDEGDENAGAPGEGVWRNYDFVPGSTVWFATDFTDEPVGRFPASQLEFVKGNMQIVEVEGEKVLEASGNSTLRVILPEALPEDFTVELTLKTGTPNMASYVMFTPREGGLEHLRGALPRAQPLPGDLRQGTGSSEHAPVPRPGR